MCWLMLRQSARKQLKSTLKSEKSTRNVLIMKIRFMCVRRETHKPKKCGRGLVNAVCVEGRPGTKRRAPSIAQ